LASITTRAVQKANRPRTSANHTRPLRIAQILTGLGT
jgi:hypothetical protein